MALEEVLELVKDNQALVDEIKQVYDKAGALDKVKTANADLTRQREELEARVKAAEGERDGLKGQIDQLKSGKSPELLALEEKVEKITGDLEAERKARAEAESARIAESLKSSIISLANDSVNPNQVFSLMVSEGLVGHAEGKPFYHRLNEKGEKVAADPKGAYEAYTKANPHLLKASGVSGAGSAPSNSGGQTNDGLLDSETARAKI